MHQITIFFLVFVCFQAVVSAQEYSVPQNIDLDEILKNDRLTRNYVDCVLGKGKCTPEGEELKRKNINVLIFLYNVQILIFTFFKMFYYLLFYHILGDIPEALQNECAKCNEKHKEGVRKVLRHLIKNKPTWWEELLAKFDPNGEYKEKYDKLLKEEGLVR